MELIKIDSYRALLKSIRVFNPARDISILQKEMGLLWDTPNEGIRNLEAEKGFTKPYGYSKYINKLIKQFYEEIKENFNTGNLNQFNFSSFLEKCITEFTSIYESSQKTYSDTLEKYKSDSKTIIASRPPRLIVKDYKECWHTYKDGVEDLIDYLKQRMELENFNSYKIRNENTSFDATITNNETTGEKRPKLKTKLSIDELGLIFRLMKEIGVIDSTPTQIIDFVSYYISSIDRDNPKESVIRKAYYSIKNIAIINKTLINFEKASDLIENKIKPDFLGKH